MKVLRIYDHLGELKREFNVYVEGEDFVWQSSYPEPVWLGKIILCNPSEEYKEQQEMAVIKEAEEVLETKEEVKSESKENIGKRSRVKGTSPSDYLKGVKVIRQDDSSSDSNQGD